MASAYTTPIPTPSMLPAHLRVHVIVMRGDGHNLTDEDIAAARATYPIPADADPDAGVIGTTSPLKPARKSKPSAKTPPKSRKPAAKRP